MKIATFKVLTFLLYTQISSLPYTVEFFTRFSNKPSSTLSSLCSVSQCDLTSEPFTENYRSGNTKNSLEPETGQYNSSFDTGHWYLLQVLWEQVHCQDAKCTWPMTHMVFWMNTLHQWLKFILFWSNTLHVSDGFSVHHQELKTVHTATGICQTDTAVCLLASRQQYLIDIMFRMVFPSIIRSSRLYKQQQAYVKHLFDICLLLYVVLNSWWCTEKPS